MEPIGIRVNITNIDKTQRTYKNDTNTNNDNTYRAIKDKQ